MNCGERYEDVDDHRSYTQLRLYYELATRPVPSWLDSSVATALHWYRRGDGFESHSGLNFFQILISQLLKLYVTAMSSYALLCLDAKHLYIVYGNLKVYHVVIVWACELRG